MAPCYVVFFEVGSSKGARRAWAGRATREVFESSTPTLVLANVMEKEINMLLYFPVTECVKQELQQPCM